MLKFKFKNLNFLSNRRLDNRLNIIFILPGLGSVIKEYEYFINLFDKKNQIILVELPNFFNHSNKNSDYLLNISREIFLFIKKKNIINFSFYAHSMGGIIPILLLRFFIKKKLQKVFINNEGNLIFSDSSFVTKKTLSYSKSFFLEKGFYNLINKCISSENYSLRKWGENISHIHPETFYNYCESTCFWTKKNLLLSYYKYYFKKKIYIYGEKSSNLELLNKLYGEQKIKIHKADHFSHLNNKEFFMKSLTKLFIEK